MVSEDDEIYIISSGNIVRQKSGFPSEDKVEEYITEELPAGEYEYGQFQSINEVTVEEEPPDEKEYTQLEKQRISEIKQKADNNDKVKSISFYDTDKRILRGSIHQQNIRYENGEVDFEIYIDETLFDAPVSTIDKDVEDRLLDIFDTVASENATYLGYNSSYAKRGRRDPYIVLYGRVHREEEETVRSISQLDFVRGMFWSSENISPVPIYKYSDKDEYLPQDYMLVLNVNSEIDDLEEISDTDMEIVHNYLEKIDEQFPSVEVDWVGKVPFRKNYDSIGVGVSIE